MVAHEPPHPFQHRLYVRFLHPLEVPWSASLRRTRHESICLLTNTLWTGGVAVESFSLRAWIPSFFLHAIDFAPQSRRSASSRTAPQRPAAA